LGYRWSGKKIKGAAVLVEERTMVQAGGWRFNSIAIHSTFNFFMGAWTTY